ncbi:MAG: selenocysteine-specific translation elongation factor [Candidatus Eremiobacteraeota bacterium]|nr:selenocysteine-specific translation elongation factor [Candidatus Eremiobacteraeota bacterium]
MHIIGTAGHVDHGKSTLVERLTGTHPDRFAEERERGMTLDLGFARFEEGAFVAGIVDVPGHERFLHNMLAGASGMEVLLLVVAATEGVMPQTREHLAILRFLNVRSVVIAVTKCDLLSEAEREGALARIRSDLAGTLAAEAPMQALSSTSGEGIPALRSLLVAQLAALEPRNSEAPLYLPIDRAFTLPGHGTIATGTLMQGSVRVGESVTLQPEGIRSRVRSLHVFGTSVERAAAGARVALNLPGVAREKIARGSVLSGPELLPGKNFVVRFTALAEALPLLRRRTPVRASIGAAEILGTLLFDRVPESCEAVEARLLLREPTTAFGGVRFVLRRLSPKTLLGGGEIAGIEATAGAGEAPHAAALRAALAEAGLAGLGREELAAKLNVRGEAIEEIVESAISVGELRTIAKPEAFVGAAISDALLERIVTQLARRHEEAPWAMGRTLQALAKELSFDEALLYRYLDAFVSEGRLAARSGFYALPGHEARPSDEQDRFFATFLQRDDAASFAPTPAAELESAIRSSRIAGVADAYAALLARGALVRVGEDLYGASQIAAVRARVEKYLREHRAMTVADFRTLIGSSRKFAVPLLEWFDARGITLRTGDLRVLRASERNPSAR